MYKENILTNHIRKNLANTQWICGSGNKFCRKSFTLPKLPLSASLYILADIHTYRNGENYGLLENSFLKYRLFLNSLEFGIGPFRPIVNNIRVLHRFDLMSCLAVGQNVIGVISRGSEKGFALFIEMGFANEQIYYLNSDNTWKQLDGNAVYNHVCNYNLNSNLFYNGKIGPGEFEEHIKGDKYPTGWLLPKYDDSKWQQSETHGYCNEEFEFWAGPNYEMNTITPSYIEKLADGHFFIDFGREVIAGIELDAPPIQGKIEIRLGEELTDNNHVLYEMRTENHYRNIWTFSKNNDSLTNFSLHAFRYAEIIGWKGNLLPENIRAKIVGIHFSDTDSFFRCSDDRLNRVWQLCKNTIKYTSMDIYQDCPSRERVPYEADSYINMLTHFAVEYNPAIARRTFEYQINHPTWPFEWHQFMIPIAYEYLMNTGDFNTVDRYFDVLIRKFLYCDIIENGLIKEFPSDIIIDWPKCYRDNYEIGINCTVPNAFLYYDLILISKLQKLLNRSGVNYLEQAVYVKDAFNRKLYDIETGLYIDGTESKHHSFHANMFALCFGLVPPERIRNCLNFIITKGMVCSVYAAQFYLEALFKHNCPEAAIKLMTSENLHSSWLGMIKQGATATMEAWHPDGKPNLSWAHPWGTAPANIIVRHLFGLMPTIPGWTEFIFKPNPGNIDSGKLTIKTNRGKIKAEFRHYRNTIKTSLSEE